MVNGPTHRVGPFLFRHSREGGNPGVRVESCPVFLDSRLRGNDGRAGTLFRRWHFSLSALPRGQRGLLPLERV
jgi:hypothetical protein